MLLLVTRNYTNENRQEACLRKMVVPGISEHLLTTETDPITLWNFYLGIPANQ